MARGGVASVSGHGGEHGPGGKYGRRCDGEHKDIYKLVLKLNSLKIENSDVSDYNCQTT